MSVQSQSNKHALSRKDEERLRIMGEAKREYPDDEPDVAFANYVVKNWISKVKFLKNGVSYIIGHDIHYGRCKSRSMPNQVEVVQDAIGQEFLNKIQRPVNLYDIDYNTNYIRHKNVSKHQSEDQWNVPTHHRTHFLKFPQEIQDSIFKLALIVPGCLLSPKVVVSNWEMAYHEPHHTINDPQPSDYSYNGKWQYKFSYFDESPMSFERRNFHDEQGPYVELQRILRPRIDATLLRTCKTFHNIGSQLLYGHNTLDFCLSDDTWKGNTPSWIGNQSYRPDPFKIVDEEGHLGSSSILRAILQIQSKATITEIPGWCYYDPLIRFLYHIQPRNAALIKRLRFCGIVKTHVCTKDWRCSPSGCQNDLMINMKCYIPFINQFCTGLQELTLKVNFDRDACSISDEQRRPFDEFLKSYLENDIRELKTVKVLRLVSVDRTQVSWNVPVIKANVQVAEETMLWFKERAAGWAKV